MYVNKCICARLYTDLKLSLCLLLLTTVFTSGLIFSGCDVVYDYSSCRDTVVRFRYTYRGADRFDSYISKIDYYLFNDAGEFVDELDHVAGTPSMVDVSELPDGSYTVVALANLDDYASLPELNTINLDQFAITVTQLHNSARGKFANGDPLFWGEQRFHIGGGIKACI